MQVGTGKSNRIIMELWEAIYTQFQIGVKQPNPWWAFIASCLLVVFAVMVISKMIKPQK